MNDMLPTSRPFARQRMLFALLGILGVTLACRLPTISVLAFDWDESTFILMGQDLLDGHLPFTHLWDIKPPLAFVFYALCLLVGGQSVVAVKIGGMLLVALSAYAVMRAHQELLDGRGASLLTAVFFVILASNPSWAGPAVMSEHVALLPLSFVIYLVLRGGATPAYYAALGGLLGMLPLIRLNLAYCAVIVAVYLFALLWRRKNLRGSTAGALLAGLLLPSLVLAGVYGAAGHLGLLYTGMIQASLSYADAHGPLAVAGALLTVIWEDARTFNLLIWGAALLAPALVWRNPAFTGRRKALLVKFAALGLGLFASLVMGGQFYHHYLLQAAPLVALSAGLTCHFLLRTRGKPVIIACLVAGLLMAAIPFYNFYQYHLFYYQEHQTWYRSPELAVAEYLKQAGAEGEVLFFTSMQIGYWLTDARLPTKYAHPSNIAKPYLLRAIDGDQATPLKELESIFAQQPLFVITPVAGVRYFPDELRAAFRQELEQRYTLVEQINGQRIYRRNARE